MHAFLKKLIKMCFISFIYFIIFFLYSTCNYYIFLRDIPTRPNVLTILILQFAKNIEANSIFDKFTIHGFTRTKRMIPEQKIVLRPQRWN